jgi:hypothetical protein
MDRAVACPACGRENVYDPADCWTVVQFALEGARAVPSTYRRVRCASCGRDADVPVPAEAPTRLPPAATRSGPG